MFKYRIKIYKIKSENKNRNRININIYNGKNKNNNVAFKRKLVLSVIWYSITFKKQKNKINDWFYKNNVKDIIYKKIQNEFNKYNYYF